MKSVIAKYLEIWYTEKKLPAAISRGEDEKEKKGERLILNNGERNGQGKGPKKKKPLSVRIYRALYTAVYVGAQIVKESALLLYEKGKPAVLKGAELLKSGWQSFSDKRKGAKDGAERKQPGEAVVFGKTVSRLQGKESAGRKREYVEDDYLDFEDYGRRTPPPPSKKPKKKKRIKRDNRPNFEELLRRQEEKDARRSRRGKRFLLGGLLGILILQLLCGLFAAGLYVYTGRSFRFSGVELYFRQGREYVTSEVPAKYAYGREGAPRVNMTALASWLEIETVSDRNLIYYTLKDGSRMVLMKNSRMAVLNGEQVSLSEKVVASGSQVYVPIELLIEYTDGLCINYSQKEKRVTLRRYTDPLLHTERNPVYKELTLTVCGMESAPVPELIGQTPSENA